MKIQSLNSLGVIICFFRELDDTSGFYEMKSEPNEHMVERFSKKQVFVTQLASNLIPVAPIAVKDGKFYSKLVQHHEAFSELSEKNTPLFALVEVVLFRDTDKPGSDRPNILGGVSFDFDYASFDQEDKPNYQKNLDYILANMHFIDPKDIGLMLKLVENFEQMISNEEGEKFLEKNTDISGYKLTPIDQIQKVLLKRVDELKSYLHQILNSNEMEKSQIESIEHFLNQNGIEKVPHIKTNFFFNQHATAEDGQMVADRLKDKDIFIQENAGWDNERLLTWQKVTSGEFTADQAIEHEKARGKAFFWTEYYKTIFENIHGTNKEVLLVDIKDDSELYKEIYDLMKTDGVYWNILDRAKTYDEVLEHIGDASQLESLSQEERENEILKNTKQNLLELLKNKPELQNKEELSILFSMGSFHTRLYHEMKKDGNDITREHQSMPYTFSPRMEVERLVHFKGREVAESSMPKVLLYLLLGKTGVFPLDQMKHEQQHMVMKKFNTDAQIRELYERYQKSESDEQFRKEINSWIAEQYKK